MTTGALRRGTRVTQVSNRSDILSRAARWLPAGSHLVGWQPSGWNSSNNRRTPQRRYHETCNRPPFFLSSPLRICIRKKYDFFQEADVGRFILIDVVAAVALSLLWYAWFVRYNRKRAADVLRWVQAACLGKGRVADVHWQANSSKLEATLSLSSRWFDDARLTIRLLPRPLPVQWALSRYRQEQETLTFEADMGFRPGFHLDVIRHRWSGHSGAKNSDQTRAWTITRPGPVILTTKEDWPVELSPVVNALAAWRDKDFVGVRFNSTSPHFSATVALENLSDQKAAAALLGLFRELAASSSAKQH
jgi:hypothetical protein